MKKNTLLLVLILILSFYVSGCTNDQINNLQSTNEQLINKIKILQEEKETLEKNLTLAQKENSKLRNNIDELEEELSQRSNSIEKFYISNEDVNMFNPYTVKLGEGIAGLKIIRVKIHRGDFYGDSYFADFIGELELSGNLIFNEVGGSVYTFLVDNEDVKKLPYTYEIKNSERIFINLLNDEEIKRSIGDELKELDDKIHIKAIFSDFTYNYIPQSDAASKANFVKLVSKE